MPLVCFCGYRFFFALFLFSRYLYTTVVRAIGLFLWAPRYYRSSLSVKEKEYDTIVPVCYTTIVLRVPAVERSKCRVVRTTGKAGYISGCTTECPCGVYVELGLGWRQNHLQHTAVTTVITTILRMRGEKRKRFFLSSFFLHFPTKRL